MTLFSKFFNKQRSKVGHISIGKHNFPHVVGFDNTPIWQKRGWKKKDKTFTGYYRTKYYAAKGEVIKKGDKFKVYIFHPPAELKKHPKWHCFHERGKNKYEINLYYQPKDGKIDSIILYVERLIYQSFERN
jgi:hypothetical protein